MQNVEPLPASCDDGALKSSIFEDQLLVAAMADSNTCVNDCLHDHGFGRCRHALSVATDNAHMECSPDIWENWLEPTYMECSDKCLEAISQSQDNGASSSACNPNISPTCFSGNISMPSLSFNTNPLFLQSSPVYSNAYQHGSHPLVYMNNPVNDHLGINMGIHDNATNSMGTSFTPSIANGNVPMAYTGSATSGDDCFDDEQSLFAAIASPPPHEQNFTMAGSGPPLPNRAATAICSQLNLEARSSPPFHQNFMISHNMNETRAIKNSGNCEAREIVSFLVESSTPAIEDGYKWCKYGQKSIKDKVHPRCYYRCAQRNCPIKKQTEGSSNMEGFVLVTYFGKHNH